ncbi:hypothetical protein LTR28_007734, partial [Elasticomyces elasticus]
HERLRSVVETELRRRRVPPHAQQRKLRLRALQDPLARDSDGRETESDGGRAEAEVQGHAVGRADESGYLESVAEFSV